MGKLKLTLKYTFTACSSLSEFADPSLNMDLLPSEKMIWVYTEDAYVILAHLV